MIPIFTTFVDSLLPELAQHNLSLGQKHHFGYLAYKPIFLETGECVPSKIKGMASVVPCEIIKNKPQSQVVVETSLAAALLYVATGSMSTSY